MQRRSLLLLSIIIPLVFSTDVVAPDAESSVIVINTSNEESIKKIDSKTLEQIEITSEGLNRRFNSGLMMDGLKYLCRAVYVGFGGKAEGKPMEVSVQWKLKSETKKINLYMDWEMCELRDASGAHLKHIEALKVLESLNERLASSEANQKDSTRKPLVPKKQEKLEDVEEVVVKVEPTNFEMNVTSLYEEKVVETLKDPRKVPILGSIKKERMENGELPKGESTDKTPLNLSEQSDDTYELISSAPAAKSDSHVEITAAKDPAELSAQKTDRNSLISDDIDLEPLQAADTASRSVKTVTMPLRGSCNKPQTLIINFVPSENCS